MKSNTSSTDQTIVEATLSQNDFLMGRSQPYMGSDLILTTALRDLPSITIRNMAEHTNL
jgi:hypothetical protein